MLGLISLCPEATITGEGERAESQPAQSVVCPSLTKREETGFDVGDRRREVGKKNSQASRRVCHYFVVLLKCEEGFTCKSLSLDSL